MRLRNNEVPCSTKGVVLLNIMCMGGDVPVEYCIGMSSIPARSCEVRRYCVANNEKVSIQCEQVNASGPAARKRAQIIREVTGIRGKASCDSGGRGCETSSAPRKLNFEQMGTNNMVHTVTQ